MKSLTEVCFYESNSITVDPEIAKTQEEQKRMEQQLAALTSITFDTNLYGGNDHDAYVTSIPITEDEENMDSMDNEVARKLASYTAPKSLLKEMPHNNDNVLRFKKSQLIIDRRLSKEKTESSDFSRKE